MYSPIKKYQYSPYVSRQYEKSAVLLSEWRLGLFGLIFSLIVISLKVLYANRENVQYVVFEKEWNTYKTVVTDGEVVLRHSWTTVLKCSWFWFPILCGAVATWFTGLMVYIDSSVPGVQPPSPFSPSKYKIRSGHSFHLNYVFAVVVGLLVSGYMFIRGFRLEF
ncbi:hypothetical protein RN001_014097 [Aquatica leii]|uniref:Uncharacterized protein n=1 Tax=Aquatica leii TaxID=1421715 RepID=A0AAN7P1L7_9COLE|nr:hypothetical protein RN001_014097 [Aquatica leii]